MYIETNRLILREIIENDWMAIHSYTSIPEISKYAQWGPNTEEDSKQYVVDVLQMQRTEPRVGYELAICLKGEHTLIGGAGIHLKDSTNAELGYVLHPAHQGNGYITEVCLALLETGFEQLGVHRIYATCRPQNTASEKVMQRIGMKREGLLREHWYYKGAYHDSLLYSILENEYQRT